MRVRKPGARASDRLRHAAGCAVLAAAALPLIAGCGGSGTPKAVRSSPKGGHVAVARPVTCGTTRTAANVPVHIQIKRGHVSCSIALTVERDYATAILDGKAPGNGGGGPVNVKGWICQGFSTPEVLKTGQASECTQGKDEILAILPAPA
jgi:hypothetical protein